MSERLLTISDVDGSTRVHRLAELTEEDRAVVGPLYEAALAAAGCSPAEFLLVLSYTIADQQAYERVCASRGLLPL